MQFLWSLPSQQLIAVVSASHPFYLSFLTIAWERQERKKTKQNIYAKSSVLWSKTALRLRNANTGNSFLTNRHLRTNQMSEFNSANCPSNSIAHEHNVQLALLVYTRLRYKGFKAFIECTFAQFLSVLANWLCVFLPWKDTTDVWSSIKSRQQMVFFVFFLVFVESFCVQNLKCILCE